ncbi:helix-turn-helix transcriptional regulator [Streptomyces cinnamoneus]|uniref:helix-turn-helix domain-containing protein n=1 Tax=Streptomyces cinnamoneus TaxID=53446 RepID=UPI003407F31C
MDPGELVRRTREEQRLTLAQLGKLTGYSAAQVSRYERGVCPLTDVTMLRRFADALGIPPQALGLAPLPDVRHGHVIGPTTGYPRLRIRRGAAQAVAGEPRAVCRRPRPPECRSCR